MQKNVGIIRNKKDLEQGVNNIELFKELLAKLKASGTSQFNPGWHEAIAMKN